MPEGALEAIAIVLSALLAVGGWLFNAFQERKYRRFELMLSYRIKMLEDTIQATWKLTEENTTPEVLRAISQVRVQAAIFGTEEERRIITSLHEVANGNEELLPDFNVNALVDNLRREVGLPKRRKID